MTVRTLLIFTAMLAIPLLLAAQFLPELPPPSVVARPVIHDADFYVIEAHTLQECQVLQAEIEVMRNRIQNGNTRWVALREAARKTVFVPTGDSTGVLRVPKYPAYWEFLHATAQSLRSETQGLDRDEVRARMQLSWDITEVLVER